MTFNPSIYVILMEGVRGSEVSNGCFNSGPPTRRPLLATECVPSVRTTVITGALDLFVHKLEYIQALLTLPFFACRTSAVSTMQSIRRQ